LLAILFRMFCESRGQLQYRIPSKEELKKQYEVGGILFMANPFSFIQYNYYILLIFYDKYFGANDHPTASNILFVLFQISPWFRKSCLEVLTVPGFFLILIQI